MAIMTVLLLSAIAVLTWHLLQPTCADKDGDGQDQPKVEDE